MTTDFLTAFKEAADKPIVQPVVWPKAVPDDHAVRSIKVCIRFWPLPVSNEVNKAIAEDDAQPEGYFDKEGNKRWHLRMFWYIIAASVCDPEGNPFFRQDAELSYADVGDSLEAQYDNTQGRVLMEPLWDQSLGYNGYGKNTGPEEAAKAKN